MRAELFIDVGNTRVKWALLKNGQRCFVNAWQYETERLEQQLSEQALQLSCIPNKIYIAAVCPETIKQKFIIGCQQYWQCSPEILLTPTADKGLINSYIRPEDLGIDRWLACIAAFHQAKQAVCVIDCGSAITIDWVATNGQHQGGWIVCGYQSALTFFTEKFPQLPKNLSSSEWLGDKPQIESDLAIIAGIQQQLLAFLQQKIAAAKQAMGLNTQIFITGGDAPLFLPSLNDVIYSEYLVLDGMQIVVNGISPDVT